MGNALYYQTLDPSSYQLLREVMAIQELKEARFMLAGGTSLALQLGHRMSTDLDLFTDKPFDPRQMQAKLRDLFGDRIQFQSINELGFRGFVDGVKFDMIHYPFPPKQPTREVDGLRLLSIETLAAMKVHAVANRGLRRDFTDLAEVLQRMPMQQVLGYYQQQFNPSERGFYHTMTALTYFGDAERTPQKIDTLNKRSWNDIKQIITQSVQHPRILQVKSAPTLLEPHNPHLQKAKNPAKNNQAETKIKASTHNRLRA
jgi:predicted nucleotidyltransferase component of viral defense system